jgi:tetratricopeptide (TPR) repeat protein
MMPRRLPAAVISFFCLMTAASASGQARPGMPTAAPNQIGPPGSLGTPYASVTIIVADANGANLSQQALVKLYSNMTQTNVWGTTQDRSQTIFDQVSPADYEVEVSAAGYETTTKDLNVMTAGEHYELIVRLEQEDSGAVMNPVPGQLLAPKASNEVQKGISDLNSGRLNQAQKHFEAAYKLASTNADLNYLLGFLYLQKKDPNQAQTYLMEAISIDSRHVRALTALGQLRLQEKDYAGAVTPLEQVVAVDAGYWMAHWLLSEAYLRNNDFEKSREQAELAIKKGKGAANRAELVKGEALANLGRREEAVQAFEIFLTDVPNDPQRAAVREMIAQLQNTSAPAYREASASTVSALPVAIPAPGSPEDKLSIPLWHPATVDDEKPAIASGVACPAEQVIAGASERTKELVDNVARFDATEEVLHEDLDAVGRPLTKETRKFDYIVSISEQPGALMIDEYRSPTNQANFSDNIATLGLTGLALAFHPVNRDEFQMTCEGLGDWHGQATWLVYFRQRLDRPSHFMSYQFSNAEYSVSLKGRAWIAASTYQIVHLEADLLNPMPNIQLLSQHQAVDYGAVFFKTKETELWLPKSADLYLDFRRHRYHLRHSFDNYKLFSVGASQKIGEPKEAPESKNPL